MLQSGEDGGELFSPVKRMEQMISTGGNSSNTTHKRSLPTKEAFHGKKSRTIRKESRHSADEGDMKVVRRFFFIFYFDTFNCI